MSRFEFRGAAIELLRARESFVIASGPAGTGKTLAALMKMHLTALQVPGSAQLLVRQTHASLKASTLAEYEKSVAAQELASGEVKWFGGSGRKPPAYNYGNGSYVIVGGLDQPAKFLSTSLDRIYVDEATQVSVTAVETLVTRLRGTADTYKQIVCMTNPDHPSHHLKKRADAGDARMINSLHQDNPGLFHRDGTLTELGIGYMAQLDSLTGVRRLRYRDGVWAAAEGLVYGEEWREDVNVIDAFDVPSDWPLYLSVDFGFSNPMVVQWWREDPDGRLYLTREIVKCQTLVEDHAREIRRIILENPEEPEPTAVICDHDLEDRKTLERHLRLPTIAARKAVSRGVQLVQARVRPAGDGKPRLYVFKDAVVGRDLVMEARSVPRGLAAEVLGYVWQVERGSDGVPKESPLKLNDHSADAARYMVMHLDGNPPGKAGNPARPTSQAQPDGVLGGVLSRPVGR